MTTDQNIETETSVHGHQTEANPVIRRNLLDNPFALIAALDCIGKWKEIMDNFDISHEEKINRAFQMKAVNLQGFYKCQEQGLLVGFIDSPK